MRYQVQTEEADCSLLDYTPAEATKAQAIRIARLAAKSDILKAQRVRNVLVYDNRTERFVFERLVKA
jgi:hypothetical protein